MHVYCHSSHLLCPQAGKIEALDALAAKYISAAASERESLKKFAEEEEKKVEGEASK